MKRCIGLRLGWLLVLIATAQVALLKGFASSVSLDQTTLKALEQCAERNSSFLKGKIKPESIALFRTYCKNRFANDRRLSCALFSYNASGVAGLPQGWSFERLTMMHFEYRCNWLIDWLNKNYIPTSDFKFFFCELEPYVVGWKIDDELNVHLSYFLDSCPMLITCNHPKLPWTRKGVLVPDEYMLMSSFRENMSNLLASNPDQYQDTDSPDTHLKPFSKRESKVYFRGMLNGPKLPLSLDNLFDLPRHHLLFLTAKYPYIDCKVTDFMPGFYPEKSPYYYILTTLFSHLKTEPVSFFEHAKNKYLICFDGAGAAWSRLELIMATGSVLMINAVCKQYFYQLMEQDKQYVWVASDLSNLDMQYKRLEADQAEAEKIGKAGREFARKFFTSEAIDAYFWLVLNKLEHEGPAKKPPVYVQPLKKTVSEEVSKTVSEEVFQVLDRCAEKNTVPLKGKISPASIERFKQFCLNKFRHNNMFLCSLFSYTASKIASHAKTPDSADSHSQGSWSVEPVTHTYKPARNEKVLNWLKKNYTPTDDFKFFYLSEEPYYSGWCMEPELQEELGGLLDSCPLLISCSHPGLPWTKKGVLIPDDLMLSDLFHQQMEDVLSYGSLLESGDAKALDRLKPFGDRASKVFFRGGLTGPKVPYNLENLSNNPRHNLLFLCDKYPYVDYKLTDLLEWYYPKEDPYYQRIKDTFSHLKSNPVSFFEHAKNKYLLSCDGFGASWARVELIMATGSVLFLNAECEQYFYPLMENNKTHVRIKKDFSNLDVEFKRLEATPDVAEKIGKEGRALAQKFFTKQAIDAYFGLVLNKLELCGQSENVQ